MIILGVGSNLTSKFGDRFNNIDIANKFLEEAEVKIVEKSGLCVHRFLDGPFL